MGTADLSQLPTLTATAHREGMIVGTPAYMSPEQARGQTIDKRTDIWAFGCVLYEMLTGRRAFGGEDVSETLARVVMKEPDWDALLASTPPAIRKLLQRCLAKDPKRRLRDIGDAGVELDEAQSASVDSAVRPAVGPRRHVHLVLTALVLVAGALVVLLALRFQHTLPAAAEMRLDVVPPGIPDPFSLALSPDGRPALCQSESQDGTRSLGAASYCRPLSPKSS